MNNASDASEPNYKWFVRFNGLCVCCSNCATHSKRNIFFFRLSIFFYFRIDYASYSWYKTTLNAQLIQISTLIVVSVSIQNSFFFCSVRNNIEAKRKRENVFWFDYEGEIDVVVVFFFYFFSFWKRSIYVFSIIFFSIHSLTVELSKQCESNINEATCWLRWCTYECTRQQTISGLQRLECMNDLFLSLPHSPIANASIFVFPFIFSFSKTVEYFALNPLAFISLFYRSFVRSLCYSFFILFFPSSRLHSLHDPEPKEWGRFFRHKWWRLTLHIIYDDKKRIKRTVILWSSRKKKKNKKNETRKETDTQSLMQDDTCVILQTTNCLASE